MTTTKDRLKAQIVSVLAKQQGTSFVELERIDGFSGGDFCLEMRHNAVLWTGLQQEAVDAVTELVNSKRAQLLQVNPLIYLIDGKALTFPVAKRVPPNGYKKPHWLPVVLNLTEGQ
jgi:hypothetical protein